jgi:hypothetical protein
MASKQPEMSTISGAQNVLNQTEFSIALSSIAETTDLHSLRSLSSERRCKSSSDVSEALLTKKELLRVESTQLSLSQINFEAVGVQETHYEEQNDDDEGEAFFEIDATTNLQHIRRNTNSSRYRYNFQVGLAIHTAQVHQEHGIAPASGVTATAQNE